MGGPCRLRALRGGPSAVERGERSWSSIAEEFFTEDIVFIDPAWGRTEGRDAVAQFMDESMAGLEDWTFPEEWTMSDGERVVTMWWNRLPGEGPGGPAQPGSRGVDPALRR